MKKLMVFALFLALVFCSFSASDAIISGETEDQEQIIGKDGKLEYDIIVIDNRINFNEYIDELNRLLSEKWEIDQYFQMENDYDGYSILIKRLIRQ